MTPPGAAGALSVRVPSWGRRDAEPGASEPQPWLREKLARVGPVWHIGPCREYDPSAPGPGRPPVECPRFPLPAPGRVPATGGIG